MQKEGDSRLEEFRACHEATNLHCGSRYSWLHPAGRAMVFGLLGYTGIASVKTSICYCSGRAVRSPRSKAVKYYMVVPKSVSSVRRSNCREELSRRARIQSDASLYETSPFHICSGIILFPLIHYPFIVHLLRGNTRE